MTYFSPDLIQSVKSANRIEDVVSSVVSLEKKGGELVGLCPFHVDSSPSMIVSPEKGLFHCFPCGLGGDCVNFTMLINGCSFSQAVKLLAQNSGIDIGEGDSSVILKTKKQREVKECLSAARDFFCSRLGVTQEGENAAYYLTRSRKLSAETIEQAQLGHAPLKGSLFLSFMKKSGFNEDQLAEAGLCYTRKDGRFLPYFVNRVMIPVFDGFGSVVAFTGRNLGPIGPKYLNSVETPVFQKTKDLYGLNVARKYIRHENSAIVVEGPFDVLALREKGILNCVSPLGASVSCEHIESLCGIPISKKVIISFDGDEAGGKAAATAVRTTTSLTFSGKCDLRIAKYPQEVAGMDPDGILLTKGRDYYVDILERAENSVAFACSSIADGIDPQQPSSLQNAVARYGQLAAMLPQGAARHRVITMAAEVLSVAGGGPRPLLEREVRRVVRPAHWEPREVAHEVLSGPIEQCRHRARLQLAWVCQAKEAESLGEPFPWEPV
jgi:DNA primase